MSELRRLNSELHPRIQAPEEIIDNPKKLLEYFTTHSKPMIANRLHKLTTETSIPNREQLISDIAREEVKLENLIKILAEETEPKFGLADGEELSDPSNPENFQETKISTEGAEEYFDMNATKHSRAEYEAVLKEFQYPTEILQMAQARIIRSRLKLSPESYKSAIYDAVKADSQEVLEINKEFFTNNLEFDEKITPLLKEALLVAFDKVLISGDINTLLRNKQFLGDPNVIAFIEKNRSHIQEAINAEARLLGGTK